MVLYVFYESLIALHCVQRSCALVLVRTLAPMSSSCSSGPGPRPRRRPAGRRRVSRPRRARAPPAPAPANDSAPSSPRSIHARAPARAPPRPPYVLLHMCTQSTGGWRLEALLALACPSALGLGLVSPRQPSASRLAAGALGSSSVSASYLLRALTQHIYCLTHTHWAPAVVERRGLVNCMGAGKLHRRPRAGQGPAHTYRLRIQP
jgi:hypothetical protein